MTIEEAIEVLCTEHKCVQRQDDDRCDRKCVDCDLAMQDYIIMSAYDMAIAALRAQQERENPKPLTLEELREMDGEPVWVEPINSKYCKAGWGIVNMCHSSQIAEPQFIRVFDGVTFFEQMIPYPKQKRKQLYGKTWVAYRYKHKEET